jgi:hypothetical protein
MLPAIAVLGGTLVVGGFPFILGEGGSTGSTPSSINKVTKPVETQPKPEVVKDTATAPSLPEIESMAGGQRGGYGRPTWAPLNSGQ